MESYFPERKISLVSMTLQHLLQALEFVDYTKLCSNHGSSVQEYNYILLMNFNPFTTKGSPFDE